MLIDKDKLLKALVPKGYPHPKAVIDERAFTTPDVILAEESKAYAIPLEGGGWIIVCSRAKRFALASPEADHKFRWDRSKEILDLGSVRPFENPERVKYQADIEAERNRAAVRAREKQEKAQRALQERAKDWLPGFSKREKEFVS